MRKSIYKALVQTGLIAILLTLISCLWIYYLGARAEAEEHVRTLTKVVAAGLNRGDSPAEILPSAVAGRPFLRLTLIAPDGSVLQETGYRAQYMENHLERGEIRDALTKGEGFVRRKSSTLERETSYYAVRLQDGSVLRGGVERGSWLAIMRETIPAMLGVLAIVLICCFTLTALLTRKLLRPLVQAGETAEAIVQGRAVPLLSRLPEIDPILLRLREQQELIRDQMEELKEERNHIQRMMNTLNEGVILLGTDGRIIDYNRATERIFDLTADLRGTDAATLAQEDVWLQALRDVAADGRSGGEFTRNERRYVLVARRLEKKEGGVLVVVRDVTEAYQAEQHRRQFTANVSHELNTPLTSVRGYAELLHKGMYENTEEVRNFAARIMQEADRLLAMIEDLLSLSRLDEGHTVTGENISLLELTREAAEMLNVQAQARDIHIEVAGDEGRLHTDRHLCFELVVNLIDNAVKYNRDGGEVRCRITDFPHAVRLEVCDNGIGISPAEQAHVFERFYRVDHSRSKDTGGTGLGLAIVKHIAQRLGGSVRLDSTPDIGTTVTITLPVAE